MEATFQLPAKSLLHIKTMSKVVDYYSKTLWTLVDGSMTWVRLSNFKVELDALLERKSQTIIHCCQILPNTLGLLEWGLLHI